MLPMLDALTYHTGPESPAEPVFSILVPSWNNLPFLRLCLDSLRRHGGVCSQIIVLANEATDGTLAFLHSRPDVDFIHSPENIGVCFGLNAARTLVRGRYLVYVNDDMYVLPGWDTVLWQEIQALGTQEFMLSATMIEPRDTGNPCVVVGSYGSDVETFAEAKLLQEFASLHRPDWSGSTYPPNVMPVALWDLVGGMSIEFSPGLTSDPDFSRKLLAAGVRMLKGKGNALVYHFGTKTTGRKISHNNGRDAFLRKWGLTPRTFNRDYLHLGKPYTGPLGAPVIQAADRWLNRFKRMKAGW